MSWCIIETQDSDEFSDVIYHKKQGKFESVPTSSELQAVNLRHYITGEAQDTLMNISPTQSFINV